MLGMSTGKRPALLGFAGLLAMIALRPAIAGAQQAIVTGKVTAQVGGQPLSDARVYVVGSTLAASTNAEGQYTLRGVPVGSIEIRTIRVGYHEQKKPLVVTAGASTTLDFAMQVAVVQLQEIVTTATGQQRRVELGNTIATFGESRSELKNRRSRTFRIARRQSAGRRRPSRRDDGNRGDGSHSRRQLAVVEQRADLGRRRRAIQRRSVCRSRRRRNADQLDESQRPESRRHRGHRDRQRALGRDLYGTDASNGVIVVTTKKGKAGSARWNWFGEGGRIEDHAHYPDTYAIWGHRPAAPTTQVRCLLRELPGQNVHPGQRDVAQHRRRSESHAGATGNRNQYGAQVSGGTEKIRYFISGDLSNETGPIRLWRRFLPSRPSGRVEAFLSSCGFLSRHCRLCRGGATTAWVPSRPGLIGARENSHETMWPAASCFNHCRHQAQQQSDAAADGPTRRTPYRALFDEGNGPWRSMNMIRTIAVAAALALLPFAAQAQWGPTWSPYNPNPAPRIDMYTTPPPASPRVSGASITPRRRPTKFHSTRILRGGPACRARVIGAEHETPDREPARQQPAEQAMSAPDEQADPFGAMPELPAASERRWTVRRKAAVIEGVRGGWVPIEEACRLYGISVDEFLAWERDIEQFGVPGLRTTRYQIYRSPKLRRRPRRTGSAGLGPGPGTGL